MKHIVKDKVELINRRLMSVECSQHGLAGGTLGLSYYLFHAGKVLSDNSIYGQAEALLTRVFDDMNDGDGGLRGVSLSSGGAGLGYMVNYLQQNKFIDFDIDHEFAGLDNFLSESAIAAINIGNTDYLHGAGGVLHYFASRQQQPEIRKHLETLVDKLLDVAVVTERGIWFKNTLGGMEDWKDRINLSLSHGLSGLLLILIAAYPHVQQKAKVEAVLREGIRFMMQYELPVDYAAGEYAFFPDYFDKDAEEITRNERLAWCYGDLNQVLVLYRAGRLLGDARYTAIADRIGLKSTERNTAVMTKCIDTHFCHGTAGLAQFYKALYAETFNYQYHVAYEHWINQTVLLVDSELSENNYSDKPASLIEGWAGVGLVLVDYLAEEKMSWARFLHL